MATLLSNTEITKFIGIPESVYNDLKSAEVDTFVAAANEFIPALLNKLVYQKVNYISFTNPFKKFDGEPVPFGDGIENVFVDPPIGYKFGTDGDDPFKSYPNNVKTLYTSINYQMQYPLTISRVQLRKAVLNEYGLSNLVNALARGLETAKSIDEYLATVIMLNNKDIYAKGFEELDVVGQTKAQIAKTVTDTIVNTVSDMALPSIDNNKLGIKAVTPRQKCLLIIKDKLYNSLNLDFLQGVFNLSKVDLIGNIIPVRSFMAVVNTSSGNDLTPTAKGDDIDFIIIDEDGFDNHVALEDSGSIYNPKNKKWNTFVDLWKIISYKYGYQARAFKLKKS